MAQEGTTGLLVGGMLAARDRINFIERDVNRNERDIERTQGTLQRLRSNGAIKRSAAAPMADFSVGVNYPVTVTPPSSGPFATSPPTFDRPVLAEEDLLIDLNQWPYANNQYDSDGNLVNTNTTQQGGWTVLAEALGFSENLAVLLGHTRPVAPDSTQLRELFRHYQALRIVQDELIAAHGGAHARTFFEAAWRRFYNGLDTTTPFPSGLIWSLASDSNAVTGIAVEQTFVDIPFPAQLLGIGQAAHVDFSSTQEVVGGAADLTVRVYMNGILIGELTEANTAGERFTGSIQITRRADAGGLAVFATGGNIVIDGQARAVPQAGVVSFDHNAANTISIRGFWSAGAGHSVRLQTATLVKL